MGEGKDVASILKMVQEKLRAKGIDIDMTGDVDSATESGGPTRIKVVCAAPGLRDSVREMEKNLRDQVVMVRVDEQTSQALDAWVETGAVKSRSEAAALFIREGLKMRADELERLRDALHDVESAKERLRQKAQELFGDEAKSE